MNVETTKRLIRIQGMVEALRVAVRRSGVHVQSQAQAKDRVDVLVPEIEGVLREADPALAEEFSRLAVAGAEARGRMTVETDLTGIAGWLQGAIDAATFEARLQAEATAYAEAKIKAERQVGFGTPKDE